jgi:K+-sensing histidine kinase KdpD
VNQKDVRVLYIGKDRELVSELNLNFYCAEIYSIENISLQDEYKINIILFDLSVELLSQIDLTSLHKIYNIVFIIQQVDYDLFLKAQGIEYFQNCIIRTVNLYNNLHMLIHRIILNYNEKKDTEITKSILKRYNKFNFTSNMFKNITHQFRQPLSIISVHASSLKLKIDLGEKIDNEEVIYCSNDVIKYVNYLSNGMNNFVDFLSMDESETSYFYLYKVLDNFYRLISFDCKNNFITYIQNIDNAIMIRGNIKQFLYVLLSIYNFSSDIMSKSILTEDNKYFFIDLKRTQESLIIVIKDSSEYIFYSDESELFNFYITNDSKYLGLYTARQIMQNSFRGSLSIKSVEYYHENQQLKGIEFTIKMPI